LTDEYSDRAINWEDALIRIRVVAPRLAQLIDSYVHFVGVKCFPLPRWLEASYGYQFLDSAAWSHGHVLLVVRGLVEVQDVSPLTTGYPRFIARSGDLIGVFEFLSQSKHSPYRLFAGSEFGLQYPEISNQRYLRTVAGNANEEVPTPQQAVTRGIRRALDDANYVQALLLPAKVFTQSSEKAQRINPCRAYLLEVAIADYEHALSRVRADQYRLYEHRRIQHSDVKELAHAGFIEHEVVWHPISELHHLPMTVFKDSAAMNDDKSRNVGSDLRLVKRTISGNSEPVTLLPVIFGWHDVVWGIIPTVSTKLKETEEGKKPTDLNTHLATFHKSLAKLPWHPINDRQGNCLFVCDSAAAQDIKPAKRLSAVLRAVLETTMLEHSYNSDNKLLGKGRKTLTAKEKKEGKKELPPNYYSSMNMTFALKSAFFTERLLSVAARRYTPSGTKLVGVQHLLRCIHELFLQCRRTGFSENAYLLGKSYSSSQSVVEAMERDGFKVAPGPLPVLVGDWETALQSTVGTLFNGLESGTYLVVDDGGSALAQACKDRRALVKRKVNIAGGIELTTSGIARLRTNGAVPYPVVNVAQSWAKRDYESPLIAAAITHRVHTLLGTNTRERITVMGGSGPLGRSLVDHLKRERKIKEPYLTSFDRTGRYNSNDALLQIAKSDVIFGCTGSDVFADIRADALRKALNERLNASDDPRPLKFVSCSSGDLEFRSILRLCNEYNSKEIGKFPAATIRVTADDNQKIIADVLQAGFPINFDNAQDSVPLPYIRLTTALLACGIVQALVVSRCQPGSSGVFALHPDLQAIVLRHWILTTIQPLSASSGEGKEIWNGFADIRDQKVRDIRKTARDYHSSNGEAHLSAEADEALQEIAQQVWEYVDAIYSEPFDGK